MAAKAVVVERLARFAVADIRPAAGDSGYQQFVEPLNI